MNPKKQLGQAMQKLILQYSLEDISVNMILKESEVSRGTFYRYFKNKQELLIWSYKDIIQSMLRAGSGCDIKQSLMEIFTPFAKNTEFLKSTVKNDKKGFFNSYMLNLIIEICTEAYRKRSGLDTLTAQESYIIQYKCSGAYFVVCKWVEEESELSFEEIAGLVVEFLCTDEH